MPEPISKTLAIILAAASAAASTGINILIAATQRKPDPLELNKHATQVLKADEGGPIQRVYGTDTVSGTVIYPHAAAIEDVPTFTAGRGGKRRQPDTTTHQYFFNGAIGVCEGPIAGITKIWANEKVVYTGGLGAITSGNVRIYLGSESQTADSLLEADLGAGNTPAYRGLAYVVFEDFPLADHGDYVPNFRFEVVKSSSQTLSEVVTTEAALAGITAGELNISTLTDTVRGWSIANRGAVRGTLDQLATAFQFDLVEVDGKIKAIKRGQATSVTVPLTDLPAHEEGGEPGSKIDLVRTPETEIPKAVIVQYTEPTKNFQPGSSIYQRQIFNSEEIATVNLPVVFTEREANTLAKKMAVAAWAERISASFQLPWKYLKYHPGDVVTITTEGGTSYDVRLLKMDFGLPGFIKASGVVQDADAYTQVGVGSTDGGSTGTIETPCVTFLGLANVPPLRNHEVDGRPGFYYFGAPTNSGGCKWHGATLFWDVDGGGNYEAIASIQAPATAGTADTALATVADPTVEDTTNTVTVTLKYGSLSSVSSTAITRGDNLAILGNEIIQFRTVTSLGSNQYRLSNLMRGRKQTADQVGTHALNEDFVLVNEAVVRKIVDVSVLDTSFNFKAVTSGSTLAATTAEAFTIGDRTYKPGSVSGVTPSIGGFKFESSSGVLILKVALTVSRNTDTVQVRTSPGTAGVNDLAYTDPYLIAVTSNTTYSTVTTPIVLEYLIKHDTATKTHVWFELQPRNRNVAGPITTVALDVSSVRAKVFSTTSPGVEGFTFSTTNRSDSGARAFRAEGEFAFVAGTYTNFVQLEAVRDGAGGQQFVSPRLPVTPGATYDGISKPKLILQNLTPGRLYSSITLRPYMGSIEGSTLTQGAATSSGSADGTRPGPISDLQIVQDNGAVLFTFERPTKNANSRVKFYLTLGTGLSGETVTGVIDGFNRRPIVQAGLFTAPLNSRIGQTLAYKIIAINEEDPGTDGTAAFGQFIVTAGASYGIASAAVLTDAASNKHGMAVSTAGKVSFTSPAPVGEASWIIETVSANKVEVTMDTNGRVLVTDGAVGTTETRYVYDANGVKWTVSATAGNRLTITDTL